VVYSNTNFQKERYGDMKKSIFQVILLLIISVVSLSTAKIALAAAKSMSHVFGSGSTLSNVSTLKGIFKINTIIKEGSTKGKISYSDDRNSVNGKLTSVNVSDNRVHFKADNSDAVIIINNQVYPDSYVEGFVINSDSSRDKFIIAFCRKVGSWPNGSPIYICIAEDTFITSGNVTIETK